MLSSGRFLTTTLAPRAGVAAAGEETQGRPVPPDGAALYCARRANTAAGSEGAGGLVPGKSGIVQPSSWGVGRVPLPGTGVEVRPFPPHENISSRPVRPIHTVGLPVNQFLRFR